MITQIEIDGFKTFKDFKVELAPFQVIVGANGSGKSNLFDALQLLGRLAAYDLLEAFQGLRGEANDFPPLHLENMARLLRQMATNLSDPDQLNKPLCQVLVTTHSPLFISQPAIIDSLLLAIVPTRVQGKENPVRVTIMTPVMTSEALSHLENVSRDEKALGAYSANMLKSYLDSEVLEEAREQLEKGHNELNERGSF